MVTYTCKSKFLRNNTVKRISKVYMVILVEISTKKKERKKKVKGFDLYILFDKLAYQNELYICLYLSNYISAT